MEKPTPEEYAAIIANDQLAFTEEAFSIVSPGDEYMPNWHIECIVEHLKAVERGEIKRLVINMPPRTLKSISIAIAWPAWLLGRDPTRNVICASYADDLAKRHSVDTRLIMESDVYKAAFPNTILSKDQNEKKMFMTTQRGFRKATSVGGSITGDGGDFLIIDDPIKPDEAVSETVRRKTNDWINQTFLTRQNNPGISAVVIVMQRLHEDDPSGHLLEKGGWHHLCLPAQFIEDTTIEINGRKWDCEKGEYLHAERLGSDVLDEKLVDLGAYGYAGQYMQNPAPIGGGEFKKRWIKYYDNNNKNFTCQGMNVFILYDPANAKKKKSDYTAMIVVGLAPDNNYYILDIVRDRLNPTERVATLIDLHMKWNKRSGKPPKVVCEQYGMMSDAHYLTEEQKKLNYRFTVIPIGGAMNKEDRIRRIIPVFESERIYLPRQILYNTIDGKTVELVKQFVDDEMMTFPVGRHDDMLDALARILEEDVYATFPKVQVSLLKRGESIRDQLLSEELGNFDKNDFTSW